MRKRAKDEGERSDERDHEKVVTDPTRRIGEARPRRRGERIY